MAIYVKSEESRGWMEATIQRYAKRCWRLLEEEWGEVRAVCDPPRIGFYGWRGCNAAARIIYLRRVAEIARAEIYLSICPRVCRIRDQNTISLRKVNCRAPSCPRERKNILDISSRKFSDRSVPMNRFRERLPIIINNIECSLFDSICQVCCTRFICLAYTRISKDHRKIAKRGRGRLTQFGVHRSLCSWKKKKKGDDVATGGRCQANSRRGERQRRSTIGN